VKRSDEISTLCTLDSDEYKSYGNPNFSGAYMHTYNFITSNGERFTETTSQGFLDGGGSLTYNSVYCIKESTKSLDDLQKADVIENVLSAFNIFYGEQDFSDYLSDYRQIKK
jgi:hypothetical protein